MNSYYDASYFIKHLHYKPIFVLVYLHINITPYLLKFTTVIYFSHYYDKISDQIYLWRKGWLWLTVPGWSLSEWGKNVNSIKWLMALGKELEWKERWIWLLTFLSLGPKYLEWPCLHLGSLNLETLTQTFWEVCLHGYSKPIKLTVNSNHHTVMLRTKQLQSHCMANNIELEGV